MIGPIKKFNLFIFLYLFVSVKIFSQVFVNEVASQNANWVVDEDGEYGDYIELYNAGNLPVDISGWGLTDLPTNKFKWVFPANTSIGAGKYQVIFADDKNKYLISPSNLPNHWETAIKDNDTWEYFVGETASPPSNWNTIGFNPAIPWATGAGGFGFGDSDDGTTVTTAAQSVYIRKSFTINNKADFAKAIISLDFDDGVAVYLNGIKIGTKNLSANPLFFNSPADGNHEALLYQGITQLDTLSIDYQNLQTILVNGTNVLALEVHNVFAGSSDLTLRPFLHFGILSSNNIFNTSNPSWFTAPSNTPIINYYHTNYKIGNNENVSLFDTQGVLQSNLNSGTTSFGAVIMRIPDGNSNSCYSDLASPNATNNAAICKLGYTAKVTASISAGSYATSQNVTLGCTTPNSTIYYTLNGDFPTDTAMVYSVPISITTTTTLKAVCIENNYLTTAPTTRSYFINENTQLPIVSVSCDSVAMHQFQTLTSFANLSEVIGHFEYFAPNGGTLLYEADCGVDQQGKGSTNFIPKSLELHAKNEYGPSLLEYKFFENRNYINFNKLIVRSGGNDVLTAHIRDYYCLNLMEKMDFYGQATKPVVLFANGQYLGVFFLNEAIDEQYVENKKGIEETALDLVKKDHTDANYIANAGTVDKFNAFSNFVINNSMANESNYLEAMAQLDRSKYLDWVAMGSIANNRDWVFADNNIRMFADNKMTTPKWSPIAWDFDTAFDNIFLYYNYTGENIDLLMTKQDAVLPRMFQSFMTNPIFKRDFINRTADLLNTTFLKDSLLELRITNKNQINTDYQRMLTHYGKTNAYWESQLAIMDQNIVKRDTIIWNRIKSNFAINDTVTVNLKTNISEAGTILINTIAPKTYPWKGVYFKNNAIKIQAIPNPGYEFVNWSITSNGPISMTNLNLSSDILEGNVENFASFTANFALSEAPKSALLIDEINYNSGAEFPSGDWIELYNPGPNAFNASGYILKNNVATNSYIIPNNTILQANERLVLANNLTEFHFTNRNLPNYAINNIFSLSNAGDNIKINFPNNTLYKNVNYDDAAPWPISPDGQGTTLQKVEFALNLNDTNNWVAACTGGSPGIAYSPTNNLSISPISVEYGQQGSLTLAGCTGTVKWFNAVADGTLLYSGNPFTTPIITANTNYFGSCTTSSCNINYRIPATIQATPCSAGSTISSLQSGNWSDISTWSCLRTPLSTDNVIITEGHVINLLPANYTIKNITLNGNLIFQEGATIQFSE